MKKHRHKEYEKLNSWDIFVLFILIFLVSWAIISLSLISNLKDEVNELENNKADRVCSIEKTYYDDVVVRKLCPEETYGALCVPFWKYRNKEILFSKEEIIYCRDDNTCLAMIEEEVCEIK